MEAHSAMRVWFVNPYALPPTESGSTRHYSLARYLERQGAAALVVAAPVHYGTRQRMAGYQGLMELSGVRFLWVDAPPYRGNGLSRLRNSLIFSARLLRVAPTHAPFEPEVIVGSSPHLWGAWAAQRLAHRYGVPFVFEIRDLWPQSLLDLGLMTARHPLVVWMRALERRLCERASRIIVLMSRGGDYLKRYHISPERVHWLPNFVDLSLLGEPRPPRESRRFRTLYTGSLGLADGLEALLEAATRLEQHTSALPFEFHLIGAGVARAALEARAQALGLHSVHFSPPVPKNELSKHLGEADAFILFVVDSPLYRWGMSFNKMYDYMAAARPIVFVGQIPDNPIEQAQCGVIVNQICAESIAHAIRSIALLPLQERAAMGQRGRRFVEQHYSVEAIGNRLLALLQETKYATLTTA